MLFSLCFIYNFSIKLSNHKGLTKDLFRWVYLYIRIMQLLFLLYFFSNFSFNLSKHKGFTEDFFRWFHLNIGIMH